MNFDEGLRQSVGPHLAVDIGHFLTSADQFDTRGGPRVVLALGDFMKKRRRGENLSVVA